LPIQKYAKRKTFESYAESGIHAMKISDENPNTTKDIFIAPENIFPEMGYGAHPEELIELVHGARKKMVNMLTSGRIRDPHGRFDKEGKPVYIDNPYQIEGMSKEQAQKEANDHIKATFDTQHLGMWWKHFVPKSGESEQERLQRFNGWYMDQVKNMHDADILGNIHVVDGMGGGHTHLPAGQGIFPVKTAIEYLKEKGYNLAFTSEGFEEGGARILTKTLEHFGGPVYSTGGAFPSGQMMQRWADVQQSYFGANMPPNYIFGAYSPSNEWQLWSQVPME
jgi:hypothetical protein